LQEFTHSKNPAELYIIAVKNRGRGIGTLLITEVLKEVAELGYSEIVLYSGETHKESWEFYDNYGFKRVRGALAPDGEKGFVWTMDL
jgi:ribosomal protein S18 acetylase RimI-like enzyme